MPSEEFVRAFVRDAFGPVINRMKQGQGRSKNPFRRQVEEREEEDKVIRFDRAKEKLARGRNLRGGL